MKKPSLIKILILLIGLSQSSIFALSTSQISKDLSNLMKQIAKISSNLTHKHQERQDLNRAIHLSNEAILQSKEALAELIKKRDIDKQQLEQLKSDLFKIHQDIDLTQESIKVSTNNIYQQLQLLKNESSSILAGNNPINCNRKKTYLVAILTTQQEKYQELNEKLNQLNAINNKLQQELNRLNKKLNEVTNQKDQLVMENKDKITKQQIIQQQIVSQEQFLSNLKQKEKQLNKLMAELGAKKDIDLEYEDNSSFLNRKLYKPVKAKVLLGFGAKRNGMINNGILFAAANNEQVYSISNGKVTFVGVLPGFGQLVVVDNGDNYMSIYSGVIPKTQKGVQVKSGQVIASAGSKANQPMGGVYFELRHLGKSVRNPLFESE